MRNTMRLTLSAVFAIVGAACMFDGPDVAAAGPDAAVRAAVDADPRIMWADPAVTNYTPPGWPFEPGDRISRSKWNSRQRVPDSHWGEGVVWVVRESGLKGAVPFGAWVTSEDGPAPGETPVVLKVYTMSDGSKHPMLLNDSHRLYLGHFPVKGTDMLSYFYEDGCFHPPAVCRISDASLPPLLRGIVDPIDHVLTEAYLDRKRSFGSREKFLEAERERYYGPGASW